MATLPSQINDDYPQRLEQEGVKAAAPETEGTAARWLQNAVQAVRLEFSKPILTAQGREDIENLRNRINGSTRARERAARPASHTVKLSKIQWEQFRAQVDGRPDESKFNLVKFELPQDLGVPGTKQPIRKTGSESVAKAAIWTGRKINSAARAVFRAKPRAEKDFGSVMALPNGGAEVTFVLSRNRDPEEQLLMKLLETARQKATVALDAQLAPAFARVDAHQAALRTREATAAERLYQKTFGAVEARLAGIRAWGARKQHKAEGAKAYYERLVDEAHKQNEIFPALVEAHKFNDTVNEGAKVWDEAQALNQAYTDNARRIAAEARLKRIHDAGVAAGEMVNRGSQHVAGTLSGVSVFTQKAMARTQQALAGAFQVIKPAAPEGETLAAETTRTIRFKLPKMGFSGPAQRWTAAGLLATLGLTGGRTLIKDAAQAAERSLGTHMAARVERVTADAPRIFEAHGTRLTLPEAGAPKTEVPVVQLAKAPAQRPRPVHHHAAPVVPETQTAQVALPAQQILTADAPTVLISNAGLNPSLTNEGVISVTPMQQPMLLTENSVPSLPDAAIATGPHVSSTGPAEMVSSVPDNAASRSNLQAPLPEAPNFQIQESLPLLITPASPAVHLASAPPEHTAIRPVKKAHHRATEAQSPTIQIAKADSKPVDATATQSVSSAAHSDAAATIPNVKTAPTAPDTATLSSDASVKPAAPSSSDGIPVYQKIINAAPTAAIGTAAAVGAVAVSGNDTKQPGGDGKTVMMNVSETQGTVANASKHRHRHILTMLHDVFAPNHGM